MKIAIVLGTRPEIIKLASVIRACQQDGHDFFILHTNQHYSANMDQVFFQELELPQPTYNLEIKAVNHGEMTGKMLLAMEPILMAEKPDVIIVLGDTNSALPGALIGSKLLISVAHIEAGLRSYDRTMPEEVNRVVIDHVSNYLFAPTELQRRTLINEGISEKQIYVVGNTIVDAVYEAQKLVLNKREYDHYQNEDYILLTAHRPANVDSPAVLTQLIQNVTSLAMEHAKTIYFPIHPRTKKQIETAGISINSQYIKLLEPVSYLEMMALEKNAQLILTDSGGIQEEACVLGVPCITLRENTERPETVTVGANVIVGMDREKLLSEFVRMMRSDRKWQNPFGNGKTGQEIITILSSK